MSLPLSAPDSSGPAAEHAGKPASRGVMLAYAAPGLATSFLYTAVSLYLLKFSTDVLLMAPATIGVIFGLARFWDAVADPLVGHLSDRTRTRWGRRRPWLVAAVMPVALSYYAVWSPPPTLEGSALTAWIVVAILVYYACITCFAVPYTALGAELSDGYHERTRIFAAKAAGEQLGIIAAAGALLFMERAPAPRIAAGCMAILAGVLMAGSTLWAVAVLREPAGHQGRGGRDPYASFLDVLRNPGARILLAVFFLEMLGYNAFVTLFPYVTDYVLEKPGTTAYFLFGAIATTTASIPVWVRLSRRFGKVRTWAAALGAKVGMFAGMGFVGAGDSFSIGALTLVFGAATGASVVLGPSLKADVVDTDEAETGERKEGVFFAAWNMAIQGSIGIAILLAGWVLSASGFRPNVPQTETALAGIRLLISLLPLATHILAIGLLLRLELDEVAHAAIRSRIRARRTGPAPGAGTTADGSR